MTRARNNNKPGGNQDKMCDLFTALVKHTACSCWWHINHGLARPGNNNVMVLVSVLTVHEWLVHLLCDYIIYVRLRFTTLQSKQQLCPTLLVSELLLSITINMECERAFCFDFIYMQKIILSKKKCRSISIKDKFTWEIHSLKFHFQHININLLPGMNCKFDCL